MNYLLAALLVMTIVLMAGIVVQRLTFRRRLKAAKQEAVGVEDRALEMAHDGQALGADWERRFWEIHGVVERVLKERDVWKHMWRIESAEHLEGQAVLEQKIVRMRLHLVRAIAALNKQLREADPQAKLVTSPEALDPIDGPPVGQAERYFERMKALGQEAPKAFDAIAAASAIAEAALAEDASERTTHVPAVRAADAEQRAIAREQRIASAVKELTRLLRMNGHSIDDEDDRALLRNVLRQHFLEEDGGPE